MDCTGRPNRTRCLLYIRRGLAPTLVLGILLSLARAANAGAVESPIPPAPTRWVTDNASFLSDAARSELDARLQAFEGNSRHQVLLWIGRTTGSAPIEDWAARAFASWRVGRRGLDDGVVLFIMGDDRKVRIEIGYGLENRLPDVRASAIIREAIVPRLREGDRDAAARAGIAGILDALGGTSANGPVTPQEKLVPQLGWGEIVVLGLLGIILLGFIVTHPGLAILFLTTLASGRGRDRRGGGFGGFGGAGGFGGGGGFSGGGGRSGGGGATGSW